MPRHGATEFAGNTTATAGEAWGGVRVMFTVPIATVSRMGIKNWPHQPGTCRAVIWAHGPQIIVCHRCRRYTAMPAIDVPFDPSPFICGRCSSRGDIMDAGDAPDGYALETRIIDLRRYLSPKERWKPTR
jgi:hypothetical protein